VPTGGTETGGVATGGTGGTTDPFECNVTPTNSGNIWSLSFNGTVFEVDASQSGKIVTYSIDGTEILVDSGSATGSVFWTSPQNGTYGWGWPPPAGMDGAAYTATQIGNTVAMDGPSFTPGLSISKEFCANSDNSVVTITYIIHNGTSSPVSRAPWEITRVATGGLSFFPSTDTAVALNGMLAIPFTPSLGALWFTYNASQITADAKGGADGLEGWAAHVTPDGQVLIKQYEDTTAPATDEREQEIYANVGHTYVEFEQQGDFVAIPANGDLVWTMHWYLRSLPGSITASPNQDLIDWVRGELL
jgi:hypothetical protein